ncbi:hypothetical protein ACIOEX_14375 [Streptomyces sp. NPDC087850]
MRPQPDVTLRLTNNRMEEGRWNRLLTILFTPEDDHNEQRPAA